MSLFSDENRFLIRIFNTLPIGVLLWVLSSYELMIFSLNKDKIKANIIRNKNYFPIFVGYYSII